MSGEKRLFALSASLLKQGPGETSVSMMLGYRLRLNEDEAKGSFMTAVAQEKPGFSIGELLCIEIPQDTIRASLPTGDGKGGGDD